MPGAPFVRAAIVVGFLAYMVSALPGLPVRAWLGFSDTFWEAGVQPLSLLVCGSACLARALTVRTDRGAWLSLSVGLYAYCMGTVAFYAVTTLGGELPYPSIADPLWLTIYPTALLAIGLMVRARMAGSVVSMWLDGLVSGLGLVSVSAAFAFPVITENASGTPAAVIVNFAYPVLDLLLLAVTIGAIAALGAWRQRMWLMIGAGLLAFTGADSWYLLQLARNVYQPGGPVDVMYQVGPVLLALAATVRPAPAERSQNRSFLVPAMFALTAISVLAIGSYGHISILGIVIAVGAVLAAWIRTSLAVREVVRLSDSRRQALTDSLTGLPNRRAFYQLLDAAAAAPPPPPREPGPAVLLVDLDRFKEINDALGHLVGDSVLTAVSARFSELVPPGGTIARLGGDELALLAPATSLTEAGLLAQRLLESLEEPFAIGDSWLHVDASIGITSVQPGAATESGGTSGSGAGGLALAKADVAMYRAKKTRTGWEIYDDARDGDAWDRLAMVEALRVAIAQNALTLEYQPIVRTLGDHPGADEVGRPTGVEALIRWNHPTRGRVPPDVFLPLAEHAGLMPAITRIVLRLALDEAVTLRRSRWPVPVSVNLSASDLLDDSLIDQIGQFLAERGLPGSALRIEITESLLVEGASAGDFLTRLRQLGIDLAVDDYGTGYSSLAYLHDLPVQYLKIDRGFTDRLPHDERTAVIVASTVEMAHRLGLLVVAEGVENDDQIDWLRDHDCDLLQGYHISRPVPAGKLHEWLAEHLGEPLVR